MSTPLNALGDLPARAKDIARAAAFAWTTRPRLMVASAGLFVARAMLPLALMWLFKLIVDAMVAPVADREVRHILVLIAVAGAVQLASKALDAAMNLVNEAQSLTVGDRLYADLYRKSSTVDLASFEDPGQLDQFQRANMAPYRVHHVVANVARVIQSTASLLAVAGLLLVLHWGVLVVVLLAGLPVVWIKGLQSATLYRWRKDATQAERKTRYFGALLASDAAAKEVRLLRLGPLVLRWFEDARRVLRKQQIRIARSRELGDLGAHALGTVAMVAVFVLAVAPTLGTQEATAGDVVLYFQALVRAQSLLWDAMKGLADLYDDALYLSDMHSYLALPETVAAPARPTPFPARMQQGIRFSGVSFRYPRSSADALHDIDIEIRPGQHVAIVGPNGSGKSTLVRLLCRFSDPAQGRITIDGVDLRDLAPDDLRKHLGVVFQDFVKYQLKVSDNIGLGRTAALGDAEAIERAAAKAGAATLINRLPERYATMLGRWFDGGVDLSTGEWQKIALARTFMREAPIVVLDEPTSALDAQAEHDFFARFRAEVRGRTAILITHRLASTKDADTIIVLDQGRVCERGTHEELLQHGGLYAQMYRLQAEAFQ